MLQSAWECHMRHPLPPSATRRARARLFWRHANALRSPTDIQFSGAMPANLLDVSQSVLRFESEVI